MKYFSAADLVISLIQGKWKTWILFYLNEGAKRPSELQTLLTGISAKVLTEQLRQLENDDLIKRHIFPEVPPKVEYTLTEEGKSLVGVLHTICDWGKQYDARHQNLVTFYAPPTT
ncbi:transcriptional regulator [Muribacter muris]|uniref:Transcriptional regulator n=1 Tax=Muribacter muris TaxID=67855 RepID=A0A4Y9JXU0_9PAST|nr:helix-turn-helix domain-containing protein [Muribacter muris]MBF0785068.1 helix-turn-helix transcriptional regulator [Muribacter muris]MBF0826717.1 helix-turn-helix transcriptional regulator [Muribacter muris]TFV10308.1 transcriptional regulator [Muribacter muris]